MHEQAIATVQAAVTFSPFNCRLKINAWLQLGRCHCKIHAHDILLIADQRVGRLLASVRLAAIGQKHHAAAVIEDALKEAQRTRLLFAEYEAALHVQAHIADTDEARARAGPMVSAARGKLSGPEGVLERVLGKAGEQPGGA